MITSVMKRGVGLCAWPLVVVAGMVALSAIGAVVLPNEAVAVTVVTNVMIIIVCIVVRRTRPRFTVRAAPPASDPPGPLWFSAGFVLAFLGGQGLSQAIYQGWGSTSFDASVDEAVARQVWMTVLLTVVLAPLAEELLIRGVLYPLLRRSGGIFLSAVLSAATFAMLHGNLVQAALTVPLGVMLALLVERTGRMWPAILAHAAYNVLVLAVPAAVISAVSTPVVAVMLCVGVLVVAVLISLRLVSAEPVMRE